MARPRKKKSSVLLRRDEVMQIAVSAALVLLLLPILILLFPAHIRVGLGQLPDMAVAGTYGLEAAVGLSYWSAVEAYDTTVYQGLDAAAAAYIGAIGAYIDGTSAAADVAAAAYGGIATVYVDNLSAVHETYMAGIAYMGQSMDSGVSQMGAAYAAVGSWYSGMSSRAESRLITP